MASYIKTNTHISIVFDSGEAATVYSSNANFDLLIAAIKNNDWDTVYDIAFPVAPVRREFKNISDRVEVENGYVTLDGIPVHGILADRIKEMHADGFDIGPMSKFLENLMENPSYRAVNELYGFLEASQLPITEDGHFLAYKRVGEDFLDLYSNTMDNSPGKVVEMPRNRVNEDKNETCSQGLHFCARSYLPHYGGNGNSRVVMVKINPADVVSIPIDYNNAKGRCCRYEVVRELQITKPTNGRLPDENLEGSYHDTRSDYSDIQNQFDDEGLDEFDHLDEDWRDIEDDMDDLYPSSSRTYPTAKLDEQQDFTSSVLEQDEMYDGNDIEIVGVEQLAAIDFGSTAPASASGEQTIASFSSVTEAMKATGVDSSSITKVCNGERQSAGGYKWRWKMEEIDDDTITEEDFDDMIAILGDILSELGNDKELMFDRDDLIQIWRDSIK